MHAAAPAAVQCSQLKDFRQRQLFPSPSGVSRAFEQRSCEPANAHAHASVWAGAGGAKRRMRVRAKRSNETIPPDWIATLRPHPHPNPLPTGEGGLSCEHCAAVDPPALELHMQHPTGPTQVAGTAQALVVAVTATMAAVRAHRRFFGIATTRPAPSDRQIRPERRCRHEVGKGEQLAQATACFHRKLPGTSSKQESTAFPHPQDGLIACTIATAGCRNHLHDSAMSLKTNQEKTHGLPRCAMTES